MEPYKIYDFEDEKAWLKGRLNGIGGSDASAVVGKNPYKTNIELFEEKTGRRIAPDISEKPYVIYGKEAEQYIRELFRLDYPQYQVMHHEYRILQSLDYPFMKLSVYLQNDAVKKQINQVVGGKNGTRFISSIVSAVQSTPALQECTSPSIVNAALLGEALNLSPSPQLGQFYMVPFDNKKKGCKEAQFQLGYKGYIQLAIRSGYYKKLNVLAIKEGELVRYDPLDEEVEVNLIDDDILREEAPTMGYFAMFEYENGFRKTLYWSKKKMLAHAEKYSFAFYKNGGAKSLELLEQGKIPEKDMWKYSSFWFKDFDGMALKTMLRQLISKWGIMSIDLQNAIDKDMAVIHEDGKTEYVDAVKAEDDGVVADQELNEVQEDQPAEPGTQQPDPKGIEASFFG